MAETLVCDTVYDQSGCSFWFSPASPKPPEDACDESDQAERIKRFPL
jgi:hypothetical protein